MKVSTFKVNVAVTSIITSQTMTSFPRTRVGVMRNITENTLPNKSFWHHQQRGIVDTLPRHLLPKSPKVKAQEISAKAVLDPRYRSHSDLNPYLHFNRMHPSHRYEQPLAVRLSKILEISSEKIGKLLIDHPELTLVSEKEVGDISSFLSQTFGGESYMRTMIMREPRLLNCDILFLQQQIDEIVTSLSDHVVDDRQCDSNKVQRVQFVLDMIRRQSSILTQNVDGVVIPRIIFLCKHFGAASLTQLLLNLSSIVVMDFHRLIRIVFLRNKKKKDIPYLTSIESPNEEEEDDNDRVKMKEISMDSIIRKEIMVNLNEYHINPRHRELIEKLITEKERIPIHEVLRLQPRTMAKVFSDYNYWLHDEIESNFYYHPLLAERDQMQISASSKYSEPILNLIDGDPKNYPLLTGSEGLIDEERNNRNSPKEIRRQKLQEQRQEVKTIRKHKTVRQLEILVGEVYKSNVLKESLF